MWLYVIDRYFFKKFLLQDPGHAFDHGPPYLQVDGQVGILVGHIDPGPDDEMYFIALLEKFHNPVCRALSQGIGGRIILEDAGDLGDGQNALGHNLDPGGLARLRQARGT